MGGATTDGENRFSDAELQAADEADAVERAARCNACDGRGFVTIRNPGSASQLVNPCPECGPARAAARAQELRAAQLAEAQRSISFDTLKKWKNLGPQDAAVNDAAVRAAREFAEGRESSRPWLLLQGRNGAGKTHVVICIVNWRANNISSGLPVAVYVNVPDLIAELKDAITEDFEARMQSYRECPLLVLDDLGTEKSTEWVDEQLYRIINHRYAARSPLVVTTNENPRSMDLRIASRLNDTGTELVQVCPMVGSMRNEERVAP